MSGRDETYRDPNTDRPGWGVTDRPGWGVTDRPGWGVTSPTSAPMPVHWGGITGAIANQTDLHAELLELDSGISTEVHRAEVAEQILNDNKLGRTEKATDSGLLNGKSDADFATSAQGTLASTAIQVETDPTIPSWAKQPAKPVYTATEVGALSTAHNTDNSAHTALFAAKMNLAASQLATDADLNTFKSNGRWYLRLAGTSNLVNKPDGLVNSTTIILEVTVSVYGAFQRLTSQDNRIWTRTYNNNGGVEAAGGTWQPWLELAQLRAQVWAAKQTFTALRINQWGEIRSIGAIGLGTVPLNSTNSEARWGDVLVRRASASNYHSFAVRMHGGWNNNAAFGYIEKHYTWAWQAVNVITGVTSRVTGLHGFTPDRVTLGEPVYDAEIDRVKIPFYQLTGNNTFEVIIITDNNRMDVEQEFSLGGEIGTGGGLIGYENLERPPLPRLYWPMPDGIPTPTVADAGKVLRVNSAGTGFELVSL